MSMHDPSLMLAQYGDPSLVLDAALFKLPGHAPAEFADQAHQLSDARPTGLLVFLTGSKPRGHDMTIAGWLDDLPGWAMIAPATHALPDRPQYTSPAEAEVYQQVHSLRISEISFCLSKLEDDLDLTSLPIALVGLSEGAVAALAWKPDQLLARVCLAWSCEASYFTPLPEMPQNLSTPILNVVGGKDTYFAAQNSLAAADGPRDGHGACALEHYENSKVILYPNAGHDLLSCPGVQSDVTGFLQHHLSTLQNLTKRETSL